MPFVVAVIGFAVVLVISLNSSWIGQVMRRGPEPEDPLGNVNYLQAREIIETRITEGLTAVNAKGKFSWTQGGQPAEKSSPQPIELTIDTSLSDPNQRRQIIDPIKDYMERAKLPSLTMNDAKSHATWTYTVKLPASTDQSSDAVDQSAGQQPDTSQSQQEY